MDPVDLEQLLYELRSVHAETVTIPPAMLTPGCVLAGGSWDHHVVTAAMPVGSARSAITLRHLHGGHNAVRHHEADDHVTIYRAQLLAREVPRVPTVPRCEVPRAPKVGDRVFQHFHTVGRLGEGRFYEFNSSGLWQQVIDSVENGKPRTTVKTYPMGIQHIVGNLREPDPMSWYSYLPADHRPFLYVDGRPLPARTVTELIVGDVIRLPGGGRLQITDVRRRSSATTITVALLKKSIHPMRHFMWDRSEGATAEHHDSGRTRSLYPTEPREDELATALELQPGDTAITAWNRPFSAVAYIEDVFGQPLRATMHVHSTTTDGREQRAVIGLTKSYLILRRRRPGRHAYAPATDLAARAHG
ncbi:hypothetical protein QFZ75_008000 [Streptomyces sp. V3I8]|uniref:hypothetical protein n=1 Tax=Streptomyces sp. V3I8 TaxID=3042279 RepID=UPI002785CDD3|nr:hypothetical protein [Streptomyces sp. V3I8]MDQ1041498.1 hypothetical protein [Streptomyces sp. V3I8]